MKKNFISWFGNGYGSWYAGRMWWKQTGRDNGSSRDDDSGGNRCKQGTGNNRSRRHHGYRMVGIPDIRRRHWIRAGSR